MFFISRLSGSSDVFKQWQISVGNSDLKIIYNSSLLLSRKEEIIWGIYEHKRISGVYVNGMEQIISPRISTVLSMNFNLLL
jgi:hypothetical protein